MKYQITGWINGINVMSYGSKIIPRVNEYIQLPHKGLFKVENIVYHISDDCEAYDNDIIFIDLFLKSIINME